MTERFRMSERWLALPVLVALALYATTFRGGVLSDDLLLNYLLDTSTDEVRVAWGRVFADFTRPWLGLEDGSLYRPVMSLSYGWDLFLGRGSAIPLHATNVFAHLVSTACVTLLARRLTRKSSIAPALVAGLLFAEHPASVEAVAWISGRVSSLETMWSLLAMTLLVRHLRTGRRRDYAMVFPLALLALWTKESAVVLPVSLLAIDLLHGWCVTPKRGLLRRHAGLALVWIVYAAMRIHALGGLVGASAASRTPFFDGLTGTFVPKMAVLAAVPWVGATLVLLAALVLTGRGEVKVLAVLVLWTCAHLIPSYGIPIEPELGGSRVVYGMVPCLALLAALSMERTSFTVVVFAVLLTLIALTSLDRLHAFRIRFDLVAKIRSELVEHGAAATPAQPLAVLRTPSQSDGIPILNPNAVFPLAEVPLVQKSSPLVGLNFLLVKIDDMKGLYLDPSPMRALLAAGSTLLTWEDGPSTFRAIRSAPPVRVAATAGANAEFSFADPLSPYRIEMVEVETDTQCTGGTLSWLPAGPGAAIPFGGGRIVGDTRVFRIDVSHDIGFVARALAGDVTGFRIDATSARIAARVRPLARLPLRRPLADRVLTLGEEDAALLAPDATDGLELRLVLLGPHAGHTMPVRPGRPVRLSDHIARDVRRIDGVYRQKRYWYYFEGRSANESAALGGARSKLDWFRLRRE